MDGLQLTFHLAGINNQNFLMRDDQTGTYWQQISGAAISGPLSGKRLTLVPSDELTFALFRKEQESASAQASVLRDVQANAAEYSPEDWDVKMRKRPTVLTYSIPGVEQRDIMVGVEAFGAARAFPYDLVLKEKLILDHVGKEPVILVVGPDEKSIRVFRARVDSKPSGFYRLANDNQSLLIDDLTGSRWNFQGCAIDGRSKGTCLERVEAIKDYWFDWRHYHPATTIYTAR